MVVEKDFTDKYIITLLVHHQHSLGHHEHPRICKYGRRLCVCVYIDMCTLLYTHRYGYSMSSTALLEINVYSVPRALSAHLLQFRDTIRGTRGVTFRHVIKECQKNK